MRLIGYLQVTTFVLLSSWFNSAAATPLSNEIADILAQRFSAAVLLTDNEAIKIGVGSFNPNDVVNTSNENLGSEQALAERKNKSLYLIPHTQAFKSGSDRGSHLLSLKAFFLKTKSEFSIFDNSQVNDVLEETIWGLAVGYGYEYYWSDNLSVTPKVDSHLMYYSNKFLANNPESQSIEAFFEGSLFNTSAWATILEPSVRFAYEVPAARGDWVFASTWSYFEGYTWGEANQGHISTPSGWYITNQVTWSKDVQAGSSTTFIGLKRTDLSDHLSSELSSDHYYETSFGWLFNKPVNLDWLKNIGFSVNFNLGSSLRGGSISIYYNK